MKSNKELSWDELNHSYQPSDFNFSTTEEVEVLDELIGQEEAIEAIRRGIRIKSKGYNLYICNVQGCKIDEVIKQEILKEDNRSIMPKAVGYLYNFKQPEEPSYIELDREDAIEFKEDLESLQAFIKYDLAFLLTTEEVQEQQRGIIEEFSRIKEKYLLEIEERASENHIYTQRTSEGVQFTSLNDEGGILNKQDFLQLPIMLQNEKMNAILELQEFADAVMDQLSIQEKKYAQLYDEVLQEVVLRELGAIMKKLDERYDKYPKIKKYLNYLAEDLLMQLESIIDEALPIDRGIEDMAGLLIDKGKVSVTEQYHFNLMIMPDQCQVPIINDYDYPDISLSGKWLLDTDGYALSSNYMNIKPGLLHYANGGYLILHVDELLDTSNGWRILKRVLRTGTIRIDSNEEVGVALTRPLRPEAVKADLKVILIGSSAVYDTLANYDESFKEFFKVKVTLKEEIKCDKQQIEKLAGMIRGQSKKENLLPLSIGAILKLVEYGNKQTDHPKRLPADIEDLMDLVREAQCQATGYIQANDIERCLKDRGSYERYLQERLDESINDATYLLDTKGTRVGQVNGLAVYSVGNETFGRPVRITATTYRGKQGIIDIENESRLSGAIHTKGVHIISGFLGSQFAQDFPLTLSCNLCFEQSYGLIDGDSASSAELYAILSSLCEVPIRQSLAVTGSVNQFGEIQPIGGVNEKVEGFFKVCRQRILKGDEGVIIPKQNVKELILSEELVTAVRKGEFHIFPIGDIWEGVEVIMSETKECVISKVKEKLRKYSQ